ncbi:WG repeat-containing protein [Ewingella sp. S1.OA.A_B6]
MTYSDTFKHLRNFSALALVLNATFSLPAHAEDAWLRACINAKTAENCQMPFQQGLAPVLMGSAQDATGLWGYVDPTGHMAIQPAYRDVRGFANDLAVARKDEQFGYLDKKGHWAIEPRFTHATDFNAQGTALVVTDGRLALIDRKGAVVKTLPFAAYLNSEGFVKGQPLASVQVQVSPALWNAETGRSLALPDDVMGLGKPQSGLIPAQKRDGADSGDWGFLDQNGEWAIDPMTLKTRNVPLLNGDTIAVKGKTEWGFFDKQGVALSKEQYKSVSALKSGSWLVADSNNALQLLDNKLEKLKDITADQSGESFVWGDWTITKGAKGVNLIGPQNQIINVKANKPQLLQQGPWLWVMQTDGKSAQVIQIYDNNGVALLAAPTLSALRDYQVQPIGTTMLGENSVTPLAEDGDASHNLPWALLKPNDNKNPAAILTSHGEVLSDPQWATFDSDLHQTPLLVHTENNQMGAIDASGKWVIQPTFNRITPFDGEYTWAFSGDKNAEEKHLIDRAGNLIDVPAPILQGSQRISAGILLTVQGDGKDRRWGLWDIQSKSILAAPQFNELEDFHEGYALAKADNGWGVVGLSGKWAIAPDTGLNGKPQYIGDSMFIMADNEQPGEHDGGANHFSLFNAVNGQKVATDLLNKPMNVGKEHWLVQPADGGVALIDNDGRAAVSKAIVPSSTDIDGEWVLLGFGPRFGAIDAKGEWQIQPLYSAALNFVQPLGWASAVSDSHVTLIDSAGGEPLVGFENAEPLTSMARLVLNDTNTGETILFDNAGHEMQRYAGADSLQVNNASEGTVPLRDSKGLYGFIDASGKKIIGPYFDKVGPVKDGLAKAVKQSTYGSNYGFINLGGRFAMVPAFEWAGDFSEKRVWAGMKGQAQLLNTNGGVVVQLQVRCNQRIIADTKGHQFWPAKPVTCANGGSQ